MFSVVRLRDRGGVRRLAGLALHRFLRPLVDWGSVTFFARRLADLDVAAVAPSGVQVREASLAELATVASGADPSQTAEDLRERFERGDRCFVAVGPDGAVAHARWVTTRRSHIPELGLDVVLRPGEAYFYNGYTRPNMRGRDVDGRVRSLIFQTLRDQGYESAWSYVRGDNAAGMRAAGRWQAPVVTLWYLRLRHWRPIVVGRGRPDVPPLVTSAEEGAAPDERASRGRAWREWFEGWRNQPAGCRSTGCSELPPACFVATADYIASTLALDPMSDAVLDVGCDSALVSRLVAPRCRDFVGVDFIPALLTGARDDVRGSQSGVPLRLAAADGRQLPFPSSTFTKVYCSGVVHTLPSHADGLALIDELVRVCAPGGQVLVAAVPDAAKRLLACLDIWRRAGLAQKLALPMWWITPHSLRRLIKRRLGLPPQNPMGFLQYDLCDVKRRLEARGLATEVLDFPATYWSVDFRRTRSNLLVRIPGSASVHGPNGSAAARGAPATTAAGPPPQDPRLDVEIVRDAARFAELREEWNALLQASSADCIFLTWEWLHTWWTHLAERRRLHIVTVRSGRELIAIAPLALNPGRLSLLRPLPTLEFLGSGDVGSDYLDLIVRRGHARVACEALAKHLAGCNLMVDLGGLMDGGAHAVLVGEALVPHGWRVRTWSSGSCPTVRLSGHTWSSYLSSLGSSHRANCRRRLRNLTRQFDVSFEAVRSEDRRRDALVDLVRLHNVRWQQRGGSTAFHSAALVDFHDALTKLLLAKRWLRLLVLHLDRRPAAILYGFNYGRKFYFYQSGFDATYASHSVGLVTMGLAIQAAIDEGVREYDLLHGEEPYKFLWTNETHGLVRLQIFPPDFRGLLYRAKVATDRVTRNLARSVLAHSRPDSSADPHGRSVEPLSASPLQ